MYYRGVHWSLCARLFMIFVFQIGTSFTSPGCRFPEFLQTDNGLEKRREWRLQLQDIEVAITVDGSVMRSSAEETTGRKRDVERNPTGSHQRRRRTRRLQKGYQSRYSFVRECVTSVSVAPVGESSQSFQRYLVTHRTPLDSDNCYLCVEFAVRSESLVQVNKSTLICVCCLRTK
jgi:hypothetical protein